MERKLTRWYETIDSAARTKIYNLLEEYATTSAKNSDDSNIMRKLQSDVEKVIPGIEVVKNRAAREASHARIREVVEEREKIKPLTAV